MRRLAVDARSGMVGEVAMTIQTNPTSLNAQPTVLEVVSIQDTREIQKRQNGRGWNDEGVSYTVDTAATQGVAFTCSAQANGYAWERDVNPTITAQTPNDSSNIQIGVRIGLSLRRITPEESESLQGFPRGYTLVEYRGKPAADNSRYRSLGNSMAVPVMQWIGERIHEQP